MASPSASTSVRIDADTRTKLAELQKRLLDQSSRRSDIEVRRGGIPLGAVVEKALGSLERELDKEQHVQKPETFSPTEIEPGSRPPRSSGPAQQKREQNIPKIIPAPKPPENDT